LVGERRSSASEEGPTQSEGWTGGLPRVSHSPSPASEGGGVAGNANESSLGLEVQSEPEAGLTSLPGEVRALIEAYLVGMPVAVVASRERILELFKRRFGAHSSFDVAEECGFAWLGYFRIVGLEVCLPSFPFNDAEAHVKELHSGNACAI